MKNILIGCMMSVLITGASAQEPPLPTAVEPIVEEKHAPKISCDEPTYQFGEVENSESVEHTFVIKNTGDISLEISKVKPACGCTVANLSSKVVPPGGQAEITTRLSLRNRKGRQRKSITVYSNDPDTPRLALLLDGTAVPGIEVVPNRLFFGQITTAKEGSLCCEVKAGSTPFKILSIESSLEKIKTRMEVIEEGKAYRICADTLPPLDLGTLRAQITVRTDSKKMPVINIPVSASVIGSLAVAPREIAVPNTGNQPVSRYVVIRPGTVEEFEIKEVITPAPEITSEIVNMPSGYRIQIGNIMPGDALDGSKLIIHTSVEGMETIEIPFRSVP